MDKLLLLDRMISVLLGFMNLIGSSKLVSDIIAKRIAENREWTDAERKAVDDDLKANKAYAAAELAKPD